LDSKENASFNSLKPTVLGRARITSDAVNLKIPSLPYT
jgi:hypothetical protein